MKKLFYPLIISALLFGACGQKNQEKEDIVKDTVSEYTGEKQITAVAWYQTSAENKALYYQIYKLAKSALKENVEKNKKSELPLAIITDLDETVVNNSPYNARMAKRNTNYDRESWNEWIISEKAEALPGAVDFFNYAKSLGVEIFYLSNRKESTLKATMENMKRLGFPSVEEKNYYLKTDSSHKQARRDSILKSYNVIMYLGDNMADFSADFNDRDTVDFGASTVEKYKDEIGSKFIVFPNPMYGEWIKAIYGNNYDKTPAEKMEAFKKALKDDY